MKVRLLKIAESLGTRRLAEMLTGKALRILCYHGLTEHDEADFSPVLFMRRATFLRRMQWLASSGYRVVPLQQGISELRDGTLSSRTVVLTFDDGWAGIGIHGWPILKRLGLPFTIYVSSHYMNSTQPVFNVAMRYLFWKAGQSGKTCASLAPVVELEQSGVLPASPGSLEDRVIAYGEESPLAERSELLRKTCRSVGIDDADLIASRRFAFSTRSEIEEMSRAGVDIQLHTHRHRFPANDQVVALREISDNRDALQPLVNGRLEHFCYPSGLYDAVQFEWLASAGIVSATTTATGLARVGANLMALPRILDSDALPDVTFRAEVSGSLPLLRQFAGRG